MALQEPWPGDAPSDGDAVPPLDAYVEEVAGPVEDTPVADRVWADRQLSKLRRLRHEIELSDEFASRRLDEIKGWHDAVTAKLYEQVDGIERNLEAYMRDEAEAAGLRTLALPNGDLKLLGGPDARSYRRLVVVGDEDEVARQLPAELTRVKHTVDRQAAKKVAEPGPVVEDAPEGEAGYTAHVAVLAESGVVLDGVRYLVPQRTEFSARPRPWSAP